MATENTLQQHMAACELTYQLMLDENRLLKTTGSPPGDDFLSQKRAALKQLDDALAMLRTLSDPLPAWTAQERAAIQKTQQIVLKALLLDRENEQLLLKCAAPARPEAPKVRPTLDQIQRMYRKHGISEELVE
jgi:ElaB/YqjD/DUF883 family membrane-anchored ribosome-binding protein